MEAYEKKLTDFERMFLFIDDELDFKQLSAMAEEVERYTKTYGGSENFPGDPASAI